MASGSNNGFEDGGGFVDDHISPCYINKRLLVRRNLLMGELLLQTKHEDVIFKEFAKYCVPINMLELNGFPIEFYADRTKAIFYGMPKVPKARSLNYTAGLWNDDEENTKILIVIDKLYGFQVASCLNMLDIYTYLPMPLYRRSRNGPVYNGTCYLRERIMARDCARCDQVYFAFRYSGESGYQGLCQYHYGKLSNCSGINRYLCCGRLENSSGCLVSEEHVWDGIEHGRMNGPFDGFVKTRPYKWSNVKRCSLNNILAIDCEMTFTVHGFYLGKVTMVNINGQVIYNSFVKSDSRVIDYNTRFSGVCADDLNNPNNVVKTLPQVQTDLLNIIHSDTLVVGHGLENDLRVLKIIHKRVIDTSFVYPHFFGLPYRRSLKSLALLKLDRFIQNGDGHDSVEDAKTCIDLMLHKIRLDIISAEGF